MDSFSYQTLAGPSESRYTEKASKFLGYAFPVYTEKDIKARLEQVQDIHPKARHICYAWRIGLDNNSYRVNDGGEPSGSAGRPILGQIDSAGLSNTLVIVIRYFGGTKLGIPGLIKAYKLTTQAAIEANTIITKEVEIAFQLTIPYSKVNDFHQLINQFEITISEESFTNTEAQYNLIFPERIQKEVKELLKDL